MQGGVLFTYSQSNEQPRSEKEEHEQNGDISYNLTGWPQSMRKNSLSFPQP